MSESLDQVLDELSGGLQGCLHTSVIDGETGLALASATRSEGLEAAGADAFHNDLYRLGRDALGALPSRERLEEVVVTSQKATFVSVPVDNTGYVWLVVADSDTTVGFVQAMMRKHVERIEECLAPLVG